MRGANLSGSKVVGSQFARADAQDAVMDGVDASDANSARRLGAGGRRQRLGGGGRGPGVQLHAAPSLTSSRAHSAAPLLPPTPTRQCTARPLTAPRCAARSLRTRCCRRRPSARAPSRARCAAGPHPAPPPTASQARGLGGEPASRPAPWHAPFSHAPDPDLSPPRPQWADLTGANFEGALLSSSDAQRLCENPVRGRGGSYPRRGQASLVRGRGFTTAAPSPSTQRPAPPASHPTTLPLTPASPRRLTWRPSSTSWAAAPQSSRPRQLAA
jgi:hypothetical protein